MGTPSPHDCDKPPQNGLLNSRAMAPLRAAGLRGFDHFMTAYDSGFVRQMIARGEETMIRNRGLFTGLVLFGLLVLLLAACGAQGTGQSGRPEETEAGSGEKPQVALYKMADLELLDVVIEGFKEGMAENGFGEEKVEYKLYSAQNQSNLIPTIARQIVDSKPDLVFAVGTPAVLAVADQTSDIPLIFGAMGDPVGAGIAESLEKPGGNTTGTTDWIPPSATLDVVRKILPDIQSIGTIYDPSNQNGQVFRDELAKAAKKAGLDFVDVSIANSGEVNNAVQSLVGRVDAIIIGPDSVVIEGNPAIASVAMKNKIPYFSTVGSPEVPGQFMTLGVDYFTLGKMAGEDAAKVLHGTPPGDLPIRGMDEFLIEVNPKTQQALGIELPPAIAGKAKMYEE